MSVKACYEIITVLVYYCLWRESRSLCAFHCIIWHETNIPTTVHCLSVTLHLKQCTLHKESQMKLLFTLLCFNLFRFFEISFNCPKNVRWSGTMTGIFFYCTFEKWSYKAINCSTNESQSQFCI